MSTVLLEKPRSGSSAVAIETHTIGRYRLIESPTGPFALMRRTDGELFTTWVPSPREALLRNWREDPRLLGDLSRRLADYFKGRDVSFNDIRTPRGSDFLQACWSACRRIPRGQTRTYAQLAKLAGRQAKAARAAGQSMRRNPLPIIVPCHRVIATGGDLHGFAGSIDADGRELDIKRMLLRLEGAIE